VARLAQTSIRFRRFDIDEERLQELGARIDEVAARTAREIYGPGVEVDVVLEAGSLLIRITLIGSILWGGYDAISKYDDFKRGVVELVKDGQEYGSAIYDEVLKLTGQHKADAVTVRDMTPGRIARVIQSLEEVEELEKKKAPNRVVQQRLQEIVRDVQAIERDLAPGERELIDKRLELKGLPPLERLPKPSHVHQEPGAILRKREREEIGRLPALGPRKKRERLRYHNRFVVK
jgi:hypothetical protein